MGREIERKFLVTGGGWRTSSPQRLRQGYLSTVKERTVRIRVAGDRATVTIKGLTQGVTRREFEFAIPVDEADEMLDHLCERPLIEKRRHLVEHGGLTWEIDEFLGDNDGLVVAEVELASEDEEIPRPEWLGDEVSDDPRYYNASLVENPFSRWAPPGAGHP